MTFEKIHKYLDDGAELNIKAVGVTFKSTVFPSVNRQQNIIDMKEGLDEEDREVELVAEPENIHDDYCLAIVYEGADVGYVPKNNDIQIKTAQGKDRRAYVKGVNQMLLEYDKPLSVEVEGIYGGDSGRHYGFSINVSKL